VLAARGRRECSARLVVVCRAVAVAVEAVPGAIEIVVAAVIALCLAVAVVLVGDRDAGADRVVGVDPAIAVVVDSIVALGRGVGLVGV
jgi:hypothetical protein